MGPTIGPAVFVSSFLTAVSKYYPQIVSPDYKPKYTAFPEPEYDFIVVGAGSAGSVVATRLSEVEDWNVAVFEAGGDETPFSMTPLLHLNMYGSSLDWGYSTVPQKMACLDKGGVCMYPRGKAIGGSSSINGMVYIRGNKHDYEVWQSMGAKGWGYEDVFPYFLKAQNILHDDLAATPYHNKGGPLSVRYASYEPPSIDDFIKAGEEIGMVHRDYNGEHQSSISRPQMTIKDAQRCSTSTAYLTPAKGRQNLSIIKRAFITKIIIDPETKTATGIEFVRNGVTKTVKARKEIILSAGSVNSPKILMLSGVGRKDHLEKLGIPVIADLPVGDNLQDQTKILMPIQVKGIVDISPRDYMGQKSIDEYAKNKTGPLSTNGLDVLAFFSTGGELMTDFPDSMFHLVSLNLADPPPNASVISIYPSLLHVRSRGTIRLKSKDPNDEPLIDPNYYSDLDDYNKTIEGMQVTVRMMKSEALKKYEPQWYLHEVELCSPFVEDEMRFLHCLAGNYSSTMFHPLGSNRMGDKDDPKTVLTPDMRVKGVKNLRVVDGSVMPVMPTGDPNAVIIMIGEKSSDIIKKDYKINDV